MRSTPFWHEAAPPEPPSGIVPPRRADVAVVGAGYTGLSTALALAKAGRSVVVFVAGAPGAGASTRNGGMVGWGHRATLAVLEKRHGGATARAMLAEARLSLSFTEALIERLPGDVRYRRCGRFRGAGSPRHFQELERWARTEAPELGISIEVIPRAAQGRHIATDAYHGGLFFPEHGGLHPALFHRALLDAVRAAGAVVADHCAVEALTGAPGDWTVGHAQGQTQAAEVAWAGNGYAGPAKGPFRGFARRLLPIPSTIIATEPLGQNRVSALLPSGAMIVDTRSTHSYFRADPDGERLVWGGRASLRELDEHESGRRLHAHMRSVFPELEDAALTHSWKGFVAFTLDGVPHIGRLDGIWHACGYNGSGVAMAPYLGWRMAERIIGAGGETGFDGAPFGALPFYRGDPWFLAFLELWYRLKDWREGAAPARR